MISLHGVNKKYETPAGVFAALREVDVEIRAGEFVGAEGPLRKRAEDEQAFMLHKMLGWWFEHGSEWSKAGGADIARVSKLLDVPLAEKKP